MTVDNQSTSFLAECLPESVVKMPTQNSATPNRGNDRGTEGSDATETVVRTMQRAMNPNQMDISTFVVPENPNRPFRMV